MQNQILNNYCASRRHFSYSFNKKHKTNKQNYAITDNSSTSSSKLSIDDFITYKLTCGSCGENFDTIFDVDWEKCEVFEFGLKLKLQLIRNFVM